MHVVTDISIAKRIFLSERPVRDHRTNDENTLLLLADSLLGKRIRLDAI